MGYNETSAVNFWIHVHKPNRGCGLDLVAIYIISKSSWILWDISDETREQAQGLFPPQGKL